MKNQKTVVVDYGGGNIASVKNALACLGASVKASGNPIDVKQADRVIFPGVGSFGYVMRQLRMHKLDEAIIQAIADGKPFLGICLGLQALFEESEESPGTRGLGVFNGRVVKFATGKVPQIGWNKIVPQGKNIFRQGHAYFVNSYYAIPEDRTVVKATTDYYVNFASAVQFNNVTAVQFHPEKSGKYGLDMLNRWLKC